MPPRSSVWAKYRLMLGFLLAPLVPGVLAGVFALVQQGSLSVLLFDIGLALLLGYPVGAVLGVPLFALMQRLHLARMYHYTLSGSALGIVSAFVGNVDKLRFFSLTDYCRYYVTPRTMLLGALMGMVATTAFWIIVRPDRRDEVAEASSPEG